MNDSERIEQLLKDIRFTLMLLAGIVLGALPLIVMLLSTIAVSLGSH